MIRCARIGKQEAYMPGGVLGWRLRKARTAEGLTLRELAERAHVSVSFLSDIEQGRSVPAVDTLRSIAQALGVSTDYLLGLKDTPNPEQEGNRESEEEPWPEGVQVLRRASSKLTPEKKRLLIRLIEATLAEEEEEERRKAEEADKQSGEQKPGREGSKKQQQ